MVARACSAWSWVGVHKITASMLVSPRTSSKSSVASGAPYVSGDVARLVDASTHDGRNLDAVDLLEGIEVLETEGARASHGHSHHYSPAADICGSTTR